MYCKHTHTHTQRLYLWDYPFFMTVRDCHTSLVQNCNTDHSSSTTSYIARLKTFLVGGVGICIFFLFINIFKLYKHSSFLFFFLSLSLGGKLKSFIYLTYVGLQWTLKKAKPPQGRLYQQFTNKTFHCLT